MSFSGECNIYMFLNITFPKWIYEIKRLRGISLDVNQYRLPGFRLLSNPRSQTYIWKKYINRYLITNE